MDIWRWDGLRTVLTTARIHLERILVGENIHLDTREITRHTGHRALGAPIVGTLLCAVDKEAVVIAGAASAAVTLDLRVVETCANLLGGTPEVVDRTLLVREDGAVGDQHTINPNALARIRQRQGVVEGGCSVVVLEAVQIPVRLEPSQIIFCWQQSLCGQVLGNSRENSA